MEDEKLLQRVQDAAETVIEEQTLKLEKQITLDAERRAPTWAAGPLGDIREAMFVLEQVRVARGRTAMEKAIAEYEERLKQMRTDASAGKAS